MSVKPVVATKLKSIDSENELQEFLDDRLNEYNWDVLREVKPDHSDYRVDMILKHRKFPTIGLETKYLDPGDGGSVLAKAIRQITQQYWDKKYLNEKIECWAVCMYGHTYTDLYAPKYDDDSSYRRIHNHAKRELAQNFINGLGIGWMSLNRHYVMIEYSPRDPYRIPCFPVDRDIPLRHYDNFDREELLASVREKRNLE